MLSVSAERQEQFTGKGLGTRRDISGISGDMIFHLYQEHSIHDVHFDKTLDCERKRPTSMARIGVEPALLETVGTELLTDQ